MNNHSSGKNKSDATITSITYTQSTSFMKLTMDSSLSALKIVLTMYHFVREMLLS